MMNMRHEHQRAGRLYRCTDMSFGMCLARRSTRKKDTHLQLMRAPDGHVAVFPARHKQVPLPIQAAHRHLTPCAVKGETTYTRPQSRVAVLHDHLYATLRDGSAKHRGSWASPEIRPEHSPGTSRSRAGCVSDAPAPSGARDSGASSWHT